MSVQSKLRMLVRLPPRSVWLTTNRSRGGALLASAGFALITGAASAAPGIGRHTGTSNIAFHETKITRVLYNQNRNWFGNLIDSQNFTSGVNTAYDNSAADDFVVPKGQSWTVTQVDVTGVYFNGSGVAQSEDVIFYRNRRNMPGKAVRGGTFMGLSCMKGPSFFCLLGEKGVTLKSGHYWVAVVANCSFAGGCGEWGWELSSVIYNDPAMWENPGGGFGVCPSWETVDNCAAPTADLMFKLQGKATK